MLIIKTYFLNIIEKEEKKFYFIASQITTN
jgi:hypothetical protein